jgi:hypothetical protein
MPSPVKPSAPLLKKGYEIEFSVDDDGSIVFNGRIDTKRYRSKPVNQIWTAMYNATRRLVEAWEKNYER